VAVDGAAVVCATTSTALLGNLTPGHYAYVIEGVPGFTPHVAGGTVTVTGDRSVSVTFRASTFAITFTASGLAPHQRWSVVVGGRTYSTTRVDVQIQVPNGTVPYQVPAIPGYLGHEAGNLSVAGAPQSIPVTFTRVTYLLTISVSGLPTGDYWTVRVGGVAYNTNRSELDLEEPNGSYAIRVPASAGGYRHTVTPGTAHIDGGPVSVAIVYTLVPSRAVPAAAPIVPAAAVRRS